LIFTTMPPTSVLTESISQEAEQKGEGDATELKSLARAVGATVSMDAESGGQEPAYAPPVPETLLDTGLAPSLLQQLILKKMYSKGDMLGRELSETLGLKFSLIEGIIDFFKQQHFIEAKRSLGMGNSTVSFALTETGRNQARECLESNQYMGLAPVPLSQYKEVVRQQRRADGWLTPEALRQAYSRMVMTPRILAQIGPAVSSGNSFLIYGQPGNGKTFLAEALMNIDDSCVYVPHALDCGGTMVQVFDPLYHQPIQDTEEVSVFSTGPQYDRRWIKCRRPFIVTGGELVLEMLDLSYNATSKIYDAPYQLKANNGIYLIDDFGRQQCTPAEILNRWIVPMERRVDYLKFNSGGKITVPFEAFLIFSTNQNPEQLGDEAFLRRIQYKMLLRSPDENEFTTIFQRFCESKSLRHHDGLIARFIEKHYRKVGRAFRRCHPRDVLSHAIDLIHFEKLPFELTDDLMDRAFESCFLEETGD
jgi:DNA-binding MarR family transcriptional regulator